MSVADSLREGTAGDSPGWPDRLIGFNPVITRDAGVMFVDLAVTILPGVPLAGMDAQPVDELLGSEIGLVDPAVDEINDRVTRVMGNPRATQSSPRSFFSATCSSISSERTSFLRESFSLRALIC